MQKNISYFFDNLTLGCHVTHKNLTIFPIIATNKREKNFLTVDEALEDGAIKITETSELGDVPNLMLKNMSDKKIFILDGEEFIGAKQNRASNAFVLVPEHDELTIPVSCVERLRWNYNTREFSSDNTRAYFKLRKKIFQVTLNNKHRNLKYHPQHGHNSQKVWLFSTDLK